MDWVTLREFYRAAVVDRITGHVEQTAEHTFAHRHADGSAGIGHAHAALKPFGRGHRDGAHPIFAEVLLHFEGQLGRIAAHFVLDLERAMDFWEPRFIRELDVHHRTNDLNNISFFHKS